MKIRFITTSLSPFDNCGITKKMKCAPMLGDCIEFTEEEANILDRCDECGGALLIVLDRLFMKDGKICVTVDTDEVRKRAEYKNHIKNKK